MRCQYHSITNFSNTSVRDFITVGLGQRDHNISYLDSSIFLVVEPTKTSAEGQRELVHKPPGCSLICNSSNVMFSVKRDLVPFAVS